MSGREVPSNWKPGDAAQGATHKPAMIGRGACMVIGTDTGVGKTRVAGALLQILQLELGVSALGMKAVSSGERVPEWGGISQDALKLWEVSLLARSRQERESCFERLRAWINPYPLDMPIAPHLAAQAAGKRIEFRVIAHALGALYQEADWIVVEGAGGLLVPLGQEGDLADLCRYLGLPVILVVGLRLGCLNHALLTVEALTRRGISLLGWVGNTIDPSLAARTQNLDTLRRMIAAPCVGILDFVAPGSDDAATRQCGREPQFDLPVLLRALAAIWPPLE